MTKKTYIERLVKILNEGVTTHPKTGEILWKYDLADALYQLHLEGVRGTMEDFAEFCHTKYTGCQKRQDRYDEWEYSYENEVVNMVDEYLKQRELLEAKK